MDSRTTDYETAPGVRPYHLDRIGIAHVIHLELKVMNCDFDISLRTVWRPVSVAVFGDFES